MSLDQQEVDLMQSQGGWQRYPVRQLEDLHNLVLGADVEVIHMGRAEIGGSLAFTAYDGLILSSTLLRSRALIRGALSPDAMTFGLGLRFPPGARQWLNPVADGEIALLQPGAEHEGLYPSSSLYLAVTLDRDRLEREAAMEGVALDPKLSSATGLHPEPISQSLFLQFRKYILHVHDGEDSGLPTIEQFSKLFLRSVVHHYARAHKSKEIRAAPRGRACIVKRARDYIEANLADPLSMDAVAKAAETSRRTLYRSFEEILGEGPLAYATRLRLHALRKDLLISDTSRRISDLAGRVGFRADPGRASTRYRQLFGELPRETRALRIEYDKNWL